MRGFTDKGGPFPPRVNLVYVSVGRYPRTNLYTESAYRRLKVSTRRKASHKLSITGLGVDHPIQTIGSNYAFIISPSLLLSIYIIPYTLTKVKLVSLTLPNVST